MFLRTSRNCSKIEKPKLSVWCKRKNWIVEGLVYIRDFQKAFADVHHVTSGWFWKYLLQSGGSLLDIFVLQRYKPNQRWQQQDVTSGLISLSPISAGGSRAPPHWVPFRPPALRPSVSSIDGRSPALGGHEPHCQICLALHVHVYLWDWGAKDCLSSWFNLF